MHFDSNYSFIHDQLLRVMMSIVKEQRMAQDCVHVSFLRAWLLHCRELRQTY